jgi:hypothetical protein
MGKMTIETDNSNPFDTKGLTQKVPFLRKGKPKAKALSVKITFGVMI